VVSSSPPFVRVPGASTRCRTATRFCRLLVHGSDGLLVDLALDSAPGRPATASIVGPTFAPQELAGRKVIALFDRAAARDFVDVWALSRTFAKRALLELASEVDAGFELRVFVDVIGHLARYGDVDLGDVEVAELRAFFRHWAEELDINED
jgi:hypothetical protein